MSAVDSVPVRLERWKLFYDDGTTFSSEDGAWAQAPSDGVLYLVCWIDGERVILSGNDYYAIHDGALIYTDDLGPLLRKLGFIKFGRWASTPLMESVGVAVGEEK